MENLVPRLRTLFLSLCVLQSCWSVNAQFTLDREPPGPSSRKSGFAITEIMYNPKAIPGLSTNQTHEFIEVFNSKPWDEDISGYSINGSVSYTFPSNTLLRAGGYVVVARVPGLIQTNYGLTNILGPWVGANTNRLPTDQGIVRLRNRLGAVLLEINYRDSPPWPEAADGPGHSLSLVRPSWGEDNYQAWAESDRVGGSPGGPDPITYDPMASIVINEWLNHSDPLDWIEIYNHSNQDVDISGAYLSDDPLTNKYRIPDGTVIPARGFFSWDQNELGFELFAGGETIFLWNSNATRILDVIDFRGASNNISQGRWPDGGPNIYGLNNPTRESPNANPMRYGVVINEIMFNPISGSTEDDYVEIYNRSLSGVNLQGWEFIVGINYVFPTNALTALMPPGAHYVIARNPTNLMGIYTNLATNVNLLGPFTGQLANGGERLVLAAADYDVVGGTVEKLNVPVSDVTYGDGGKWGFWSDGLGSSLELIDPEGDVHHPSNWADSNDTGESQWTAIEFNGPLGETLGSPVNDSLIIMLQGFGECLVDELEVRVDNGPNLVNNGGFESGLAGWSLQGSHDFSTIENEGFAGTKSLHVRAGSRGDNQSNRILSQPLANPVTAGPHTISMRAKVRWLRGFPEVLLRMHGSATEAYGRMSLPRKLGTPGVVNSTRIANAGPAVYEVKHSPVLPVANENVVVSARATDRQGIAALKLRYRIDPISTYTDVTMHDNGAGGDDIAGDGIYSATIPGQAAGEMTPFYVEARDGQNAIGTFPIQVFPRPGFDRCWPNDAPVRECLVRWGEVQMSGDFATYHLWVSAVNSNRWHTRSPMDNTDMDATFVYNNARVFYNALPLFSGSPFHRTNSTTGPAGPMRVDYEMNFPDDDPFLGATDFVLNNPGNPDQFTISDQSAVAEQTVYKIFEGLGLVNNHRRYIHMFVNGSQRSKAYERAGNFIFEDSQQPNGDVVAEWYPNDAGGQLFKVEDWFEFGSNGFDVNTYNDADMTRRTIQLNGLQTFVPAPYRFMFRKRSVGVGNSANDYSTIFALIDAASPSDNPNSATVDPEVFATAADYEAWMRHFAVQRAVGNFDSYGWNRGKNDYLYRTALGFAHMPWDIDYSLGLGRPANEPLFETSDPRIAAMYNTPAIQRAYWRAFRDLVNGPFNNAHLDPFIDARVNALLTNNIDIDLNAVTMIKNYIGARSAYLQSQLTSVDAVFAVDAPPYSSTTNNLYIINGTAPVEIKTITLNGAAYPITWSSATTFTLRVVLDAGTNIFTLQGFDRFGIALSNAVQTFAVEYTGPVLDPSGAIVLNEIMSAPANPNAQFIEIVNNSGLVFSLTGWRVPELNYAFPARSMITNGQILVLVRDQSIFRLLHPGVPIFGTFSGSLSPTGQLVSIVRTNLAGDVLVDAVRYEIASPWPGAVPGSSLQLIDINQDNGRPPNWAYDLITRATPGAVNSIAAALVPAFDPLWLNEVQVESINGPLDNFGERDPWVEIFNSGAAPLNLDGYFLANNFTTNLTAWAFPPGTVINPGEHKLVWADGQPLQTTALDWHTGFRLGYNGVLALTRLVSAQPQIVDYLAWSRLGVNTSYGGTQDGQMASRAVLSHPTPAGTNTSPVRRVFINEWVARNTSGARDPATPSGDYDDWFEVYNAESTLVDLGNYYLTDDALNPTKYRVPNNGRYRLVPGAFFLVWADNEASENSPLLIDLHVNFQLGSSSGYIGLYAPDGVTLVDSISYGAQLADVAEGRYTDGASYKSTMFRPTPRGPNSVTNYNTPPFFPVITNRTVLLGQILSVTVRATDPDTNALIYIGDQLPPHSSVLSGGVLRGTNTTLGEFPTVITAVDNGVPPRSNSVSFLITVVSTNSVSTNNAGTPGSIIYSAARVDGQTTFTFDTIPGRTYRVYYKDTVDALMWVQLDRDFVAANPSTSLSDPTAQPQRYYTVVRFD